MSKTNPDQKGIQIKVAPGLRGRKLNELESKIMSNEFPGGKMKRFNISTALFLVLILFAQISFGQSLKAKDIDKYIKPFADADQFSGVVLVSQNGRIIYEKAYGYANADFKILNRLDTRFGIASVTKPMTGIILNRLAEEKKLAPEDKISKYIPDFPNGEKITIQMIRAHRSGIPHRVMRPEEEALAYTSAEFIEKVKQAKLAFEPDAQRLYSSAGFSVLARIAEIASGKSYAELLRQYVLAPGAMNDSLDFNSTAIIERRSQDYLLEAGGIINAPLKDYSFLVGAGSVYSTAGDIYKFGEAILDGKYGETTKSIAAPNNEVSYNGSTNGHRAYFKINRTKKWGFVLVSNLNSGANDIIIQNLESVFDGKQVAPPIAPQPKIITNPNKNLAEFEGKYLRQGGGEFDLLVKNGVLYAGDIKLNPTATDRFFEYRFFGDVSFIRDGAGKIKEIKWASPGVESIWVKQ